MRRLERRIRLLEQYVPGSGLDAAFYRALEERFRGSRAEIIERMQVYRQVAASLLTQTPHGDPGSFHTLDLGCGRGELLEVLSGMGIPARGVDLNRHQVREATSMGLNARVGDLFRALALTPAESLDLITSVHVVEHLPHASILDLLAEAMRVLRPGGAIALETPDPGQLQVGAETFHIDPTHIRPLPRVLLVMLMEYSGFVEVVARRFRPDPLIENPDVGGRLPPAAAARISGARDVIVVGRKPKAAAGTAV